MPKHCSDATSTTTTFSDVSTSKHQDEDVMTLLRACGACARPRSLKLNLPCIRQPSFQLQPLASATCIPTQLLASQCRTRSDYAATPANKPAYRYPENLNVFNAGSVPTVALGLTRVVTNVIFAYGILWAAPSMFFNPEAPWYMVPTVAIGASIPLVAAGLAFGGYVNHINILLPTSARRSKEDLAQFSSAIPPTTIVQLKSMWFRPWPVTKEIFFEDLRRLPRKWYRLANLEYCPPSNRELVQKNPMWNWLVGSLMGRYTVSKVLVKDRSRAPGVWQTVWEQIPMVGEEPPVREQKPAEKVPVVAANRPAVVANRSAPTVSSTRKGAMPQRAKGRSKR